MRVGHLAEDALDVGPEPDVEHPVGLVEDDVEDVAEVERPPLDVVEHAAGRADDDVDAAVQGPELPLDRLAAVDAADGDVLAVGELLQLDDDLLDELAGRRQDDGLGAPAAGFEHLDQRDAEGGGLAGAGLGLADDVVAVEGLGDEGGLDGGGRACSGRVSGPRAWSGSGPSIRNPEAGSSSARRIKQSSRNVNRSVKVGCARQRARTGVTNSTLLYSYHPISLTCSRQRQCDRSEAGGDSQQSNAWHPGPGG